MYRFYFLIYFYFELSCFEFNFQKKLTLKITKNQKTFVIVTEKCTNNNIPTGILSSKIFIFQIFRIRIFLTLVFYKYVFSNFQDKIKTVVVYLFVKHLMLLSFNLHSMSQAFQTVFVKHEHKHELVIVSISLCFSTKIKNIFFKYRPKFVEHQKLQCIHSFF